jgi:hypothetical protein
MMFVHKSLLSNLGASLAFVLLILATEPASAQTPVTSPNTPTASSQNIPSQLIAAGNAPAIDSGAEPKPVAAAELKPVAAAESKPDLPDASAEKKGA